MPKVSSIQVIERMSRLLDAIAAYDDAVSLKFLSADTGLHPSTAYRILASMTEHGFTERTASGAYRLGRKLRDLGCRVNAGIDIRREAHGVMERLRDEIGESVNLTVREGDQVVYIERAIANRMMRVEQVIGSRAPLHVTAVGKMMLATGGDDEIAGYAGRTGLPRFTPNTITTLPALQQAAREALEQGFAYDNEEAETGVGCIGVLIRDGRGGVVAGLSISAPIERRRDEWIPRIQAARDEIARRLGYPAP
ncbi:MAG TPA: IclR family transcriptional regulator [Sedimenticola thiotaurini]|uniref:HTH-type transcriptional repressor AllR n=1 Tax=Sedimenticola thiotaurini TaxID=1543721 RepID=A0A831RMP8_9GAMM|nr:IclR family transcriptional regulator [Sedimenticola thiotaurini]